MGILKNKIPFDLQRRGQRDSSRHNEKVKEAIKRPGISFDELDRLIDNMNRVIPEETEVRQHIGRLGAGWENYRSYQGLLGRLVAFHERYELMKLREMGYDVNDPNIKQEDFLNEASRISGRKLTPKESSSFWCGEAFNFIERYPSRWGSLVLKKTLIFFN